MPKELIGERDGQKYYVGANTEQPSADLTYPRTNPTVNTNPNTNPNPLPPTQNPVVAPQQDQPIISNKPSAPTAPTKPVSVEDSILERQKASEKYIETIKQQFASKLASEQQRGQERLSETNAMNVARGLVGSAGAGQAVEKTKQFNKQQEDAILEEQAAKINSILDNAESRGIQIAQIKQQQYNQDYETYQKNLEKYTNEAKADFALVAQTTPKTWDEFKKTVPNSAKQLMEQAGFDELQAASLWGKQQATQWDEKFSHYDEKRGVYLMVGKKPDGSLITQEVKAGSEIPAGYKPQMLGDQMFLVGENGVQIDKDGNITGLLPYGNTGQFKTEKEKANDLTPYQVLSYKNQIEDNMRGNLAIKSFAELQNFGVPVLIENFEKGQTDNIADTVLMRGLAKVTDPTTGVREEEYRTFEDAVGAVNRIYKIPSKWLGKGSLTKEGREAMIREIKDRYEARKADYIENYNYYKGQAEQIPGVTIPPAYKGVMPEPVKLTPLNKSYSSSNPLLDKYPYAEVENILKIAPDATEQEIMEALPELNLDEVGGDTYSATGMRTDRHNNPTAFTTDIAKMAGLKEGVDYEKGDPFNGGKFYTAVLKDPIGTTIKVIDKLGFYTASGKPRWSYVNKIPQAKNWNKLSYEQKKQVIGQMYQYEGGSKLSNLFG